jgi:cytidylate kinase
MLSVTNSIIVFGGSSRTGKTTLARRLADLLRCKFVSFGDNVRTEASKRGISSPTRRYLQDLGQELVQTDVLSFCREVLKTVAFSPGEQLVIDGVRHREALQAISDLSGGQSIKLIYLYAPVGTRNARNSVQSSDLDLHSIDAHEVESQTNSQIRDMADLAVDTSGDSAEVLAEIANWLREERPKRSACFP